MTITDSPVDNGVNVQALLCRHPGLRLAVDRDALAWAHGDGLVLRGLLSLPIVLGSQPKPEMNNDPIPSKTKENQ